MKKEQTTDSSSLIIKNDNLVRRVKWTEFTRKIGYSKRHQEKDRRFNIVDPIEFNRHAELVLQREGLFDASKKTSVQEARERDLGIDLRAFFYDQETLDGARRNDITVKLTSVMIHLQELEDRKAARKEKEPIIQMMTELLDQGGIGYEKLLRMSMSH